MAIPVRTTVYFADSWYIEEAHRRHLNVSAICLEAIRKAVENADTPSEEALKIFKDHFLPIGKHLSDKVVFLTQVKHFDSLVGKTYSISRICQLLDNQSAVVDRTVFAYLLEDIKGVIPTFNEQKAMLIWDSAHGLKGNSLIGQ